MKDVLLSMLNDYLSVFPEEAERQSHFESYLQNHRDGEIVDWNNFDGHVVASGFIYARQENKFLVLYHKDLKMYLYPGGHIIDSNEFPLEAAKREILEETGLANLKQLTFFENDCVPIDIDTHTIEYNERLALPAHRHFDFRYLFAVDQIPAIKIDKTEMKDYKWIDISELRDDPNYGNIAKKNEKMI